MRKHEKIPVLWTLFLIFMSLQLIKAHDWNKIKKNIQAIKQDCGEVCDTSDNFEKKDGKYFDIIHKEFECDMLLTSSALNPTLESAEQMPRLDPPMINNIPMDIAKLYTYDGRVPLYSRYYSGVRWK